jgi:hypothetical protein
METFNAGLLFDRKRREEVESSNQETISTMNPLVEACQIVDQAEQELEVGDV